MKTAGLILLAFLISVLAGESEALICRSVNPCLQEPCPIGERTCKAGEVCFAQRGTPLGCLNKQECLEHPKTPENKVICCETDKCN
ncbi:hypothetical protein NDU88_004429 [Pleurodeles waltl]|uniref:Uncharacterized protein n=1 Tax=Pleurodeles waltl TaxID=8319 RepID=A0AAV7T9C4_PLEWA|nr:hypothetical protein NDU88_004429 [Pleurodeles waltl]